MREWEWEGMGINILVTGGSGNVLYYHGHRIGTGIRSWEWEGMGSKKSFPHISIVCYSINTNTYAYS